MPRCLGDTDEIVATVCCIAWGCGGIYLEDIAAPRCFILPGPFWRRLAQQVAEPVRKAAVEGGDA